MFKYIVYKFTDSKFNNRYIYYFIYMVFNILDAYLTIYNLNTYSNIIEINFVLRELIYINPNYLIIYKFISGCIVLLGANFIYKRHNKLHNILIGLSIIFMVIGCLSAVIIWI